MRSHPEQTTSPPLMVLAFRAPARVAEGQAGPLSTRPTPDGGTAAGTSLSRGAPRSDRVGWLRGAPGLRVPASPPQVGGREQKRGAPPRPTPRGRDRRPPRAPRPPFSAPAWPPGALSHWPPEAIGLRGTLPRHRAGASVLLRSAPLGQHLPRAFFRNRHYTARAHSNMHARTLTRRHNAQRGAHSGALALGFGAPGAILFPPPPPPPPRGRVGHFSARRRSWEERGSRGAPVGSGRRAGPGSAGKRGASLGGGRWEGS